MSMASGSRSRRSRSGSWVRRMIRRCRLPIAAGGGIRSVEDAKGLFAAGADKIIVLDHGRLVEEGSHDSLMARRGLYAQLQEAQLRD